MDPLLRLVCIRARSLRHAASQSSLVTLGRKQRNLLSIASQYLLTPSVEMTITVKFVLVIGNCCLGFIWDLVLGIWDLRMQSAEGLY